MGQLVQMVGAVLVVSAYVAASKSRLRFDSIPFLAMNAVGAGILTVVAAVNRDYGFLLLEAVWTWVSTRGLRRAVKAAREEAKRTKPKRSTSLAAARRRRKNPLRRVR